MKKILITGASSGIGNYLAENLKNDFKIIGIGRSKKGANGIDYFRGDVNDENFINYVYDRVDFIDYLILNAGVGYFDKFENISVEEHKEIINTNLLSPIIFTSVFLKKIRSGIIFMGSISSKKSLKFGASYSASKFGLRGFALSIKNEFPGKKIHLINPRIVGTNFHKNSKIGIVGKFKETKIEDILEVVKNIINGSEKRFEIDL